MQQRCSSFWRGSRLVFGQRTTYKAAVAAARGCRRPSPPDKNKLTGQSVQCTISISKT